MASKWFESNSIIENGLRFDMLTAESKKYLYLS
jgi:hypothetical protein